MRDENDMTEENEMTEKELEQAKYHKYFKISVTAAIILFALVVLIFLWKVVAVYAAAWTIVWGTFFLSILAIFGIFLP